MNALTHPLSPLPYSLKIFEEESPSGVQTHAKHSFQSTLDLRRGAVVVGYIYTSSVWKDVEGGFHTEFDTRGRPRYELDIRQSWLSG